MNKLIKETLLIVITILLFSLCSNAQTVKGIIIDKSTSEPLPGANVAISDTGEGTISDSEGAFKLNLPEWQNVTLHISFIGYQSKEINLTKENGDHILEIKLESDQQTLGEVTIAGAIANPVRRDGDALFTGTALTSKGLSTGGVPASTSVYHALDILPGILTEGVDGYGLSEKSVRIRGIRSTFSGMTVEGFPNYGIMPIGARDDIYDMENMESIALYKGATPADLGTATGSKGGAIELKYRRPKDQFNAEVSQSIGNHKFTRTFTRVDLGSNSLGTSAFISFSATKADKWKGAGEMGPRYNAVAGISQQINDKIDIELFLNYNTIDRNNYRALSYEKTQDLKNNYKIDFVSQLSGNPEQDFHYYGYNNGSFSNLDIMTMASYNSMENITINLKAYISTEDAEFYETVERGPNYFKDRRSRDINRIGVIPEVQGSTSNFNYSLGYWLELSDTDAQVYNSMITKEGLTPMGYGFFSVDESRGVIHSPYAKIAYSQGNFNFQTGLKYFHFTDPATERYNSVSPTQLANNPNPALYTDKIRHSALLPSIGIGYSFDNQRQLYINYGKNYMRPYMYSPIISLYVNNMETFTSAGVNLQDIFDNWKMETSHHFDLGMKYVSENITFSPSIHYARHNNVLASAYDSTVELDYFQNVGQQTAWGIDTEFYFHPASWLTLIMNPTYTNISYDKNLKRSDEIIEIKGNQSPATPRFNFKSGTLLSINKMNISLICNYIGNRYGDATNMEKIDAYTLFNFSLNYNFVNIPLFKDITAGVDIKNMFNTKHVGIINTSDDSRQGNASYYAGSPRIVSGKISLKF
ncbi:TonB-dependent receptor [Marinilabiliaceae bacterium ANBcel2]|nr:TonB-dependent receptor [Marinilabiliaceae bacterium ANBcel2]